MDNAASRNDIPGEDHPAPPPTTEDVTPQSSRISGQDREYNMWSEDIFSFRMPNFQSENLHFYYKDHRGQIQGPLQRDEMINWLEHGLQVRVDEGLFEPVLLKDIMTYVRTQTRIPPPIRPISRPNGAVQPSSSGIMPPVAPDAPENARISEDVTQTTGLESSASESTEVRPSLECIPDTKISEDVTQTTGLKSSASESTEVNTSLECIPDSSHETVNSVTTEAGEREEASEEMTPMSPSESLPGGISATAALQKGGSLTEIVQEEKERREASGMGKIDMSLREKRSLGKNHTGGKRKQRSIFDSSSRRGVPMTRVLGPNVSSISSNT